MSRPGGNPKTRVFISQACLLLTNSRALIDQDGLFVWLYGVDTQPLLLPPMHSMLAQPADHREASCMLLHYHDEVQRSSSRLRHMFTDLMDSFLI